MRASVGNDLGGLVRQFAVRENRQVKGNPDLADVSWNVMNTTSSSSGELVGAVAPDVMATEVATTDDPNGAMIHADVAAGKWRTESRTGGGGGGAESRGGFFGSTSIVFSSAIEGNGGTHIVFAATGLGSVDTRIVAIDRAGKAHPAMQRSGTTSGSVIVSEYVVNLRIAQIMEWQL